MRLIKINSAYRLKASQQEASYLEGSRGPIYHYTNLLYLDRILEMGGLGVIEGWKPTGDRSQEHLVPGWVSFTRDPRYRVKGRDSNVRFTFDLDTLINKGYKIRASKGLFVKNVVTEEFPDLPEARVEAEEKVWGPVKLKDGLTQIALTRSGHKEVEDSIKRTKEGIANLEKLLKMIRNKDFSIEAYSLHMGAENLKQQFYQDSWKRMEQKHKEDPSWWPKWFTEANCLSFIKWREGYLAKDQQLLKYPVLPF